MNASVTRRRFLATTAGLCGGVALGGPLVRSVRAEAARPVLPIACVDYIVLPLKQKDIWTGLKTVGAEGVQLQVAEDLSLPNLTTPETKYTIATPDDIARVAAAAKAAGIKITAFCMANRFDSQPEKQLSWCGQAARAAQQLGVPAIRIDVVPEKLSREEFQKQAIAALTKIMADTEPTGVRFGIENHGSTTNDPTFLSAVLSGVGSKRLGVTLDTANFYWYGHPLSKVYELYEQFAPFAVHTHLKSIKYPESEREKQRERGWKYDEYACPIDEGDIDFARVIAILKKASYPGDLCIEDEYLGRLTPEQAAQRLSKQIQYLKQLRG